MMSLFIRIFKLKHNCRNHAIMTEKLSVFEYQHENGLYKHYCYACMRSFLTTKDFLIKP